MAKNVLCMKVLSYGIELVMVSKQQRIFQNLKRYFKNGMDLLAYVKNCIICSFLHHKLYGIELQEIEL